MRNISTNEITDIVAKLTKDTALYLREDVLAFYNNALNQETEERAKAVLSGFIQNAKIAKEKKVPYCQDTGFEVIFCEIGQDVHINDGSLEEAIQEGVKIGSKEGFLRQSIVEDPINRKNTKTNTPAIVHYSVVPGNTMKFSCIAKGFGCENKGQVAMLNPTATTKEIQEFVIQVISKAGPNACPPFLVGIGLGGTMDKACELAKKALLLTIGERNKKAHLAKMEIDILEAANKLDIGPLAFGGKTTCMDVKIKEYACHIAGLPVAVNLGCHALRTKTIII
jgi:fumarate hydratase subunit alpha